MLLNLNKLLSPDLLYVLASMGHGDQIVIADANYPGAANNSRCIRADGITADDMARAILTVMPLDTYCVAPARVMQVVNEPDTIPSVVDAFQKVIDATADVPCQIEALERFDFYEQAATAFAVVQTGETRLYGNLILSKGVVAP